MCRVSGPPVHRPEVHGSRWGMDRQRWKSNDAGSDGRAMMHTGGNGPVPKCTIKQPVLVNGQRYKYTCKADII